MLLTSIYNRLTILLFSMIACQAAPTDNDTAVDYPNRIVLIRHGEKGFRPGDVQVRRALWPGPPGRFPSGLNDDGKKRAQWLRKLFANGTEFDFGLIFAAPREAETKETERTYATVAPLAQDLGLDIDISCANSGASCVAEKVSRFVEKSDKDILIAWKHRDLNVIATALGARNARYHYPDERYDIIWIMEHGQIVEKRSMHCPDLDDRVIDEGDPDLVVEPLARQSWWLRLIALWRHLVHMISII